MPAYSFKIGDKVRIVGMKDVFEVSKYWDGYDDVCLETPMGRLAYIDYRGLEVAPDTETTDVLGAVEKYLINECGDAYDQTHINNSKIDAVEIVKIVRGS